MRLRTELVNTEIGKYASGEDWEISNDAMAAHALMQAMKELQPNILCDAIQQRADKLMREWTKT